MQSAWIVPRANVSTLCRFEDGNYREGVRLVDVKSLPMPPGAPHANRALVTVDHGKLRRHHDAVLVPLP